jgi:hypothetical protein
MRSWAFPDAVGQAVQSAVPRLIPWLSREAAGSPALLLSPGKQVRLANAVSRLRIEETARASFWATTVRACPWPGFFSKRARDFWPTGLAHPKSPAAAEQAQVREAWPIVAPEVPER